MANYIVQIDADTAHIVDESGEVIDKIRLGHVDAFESTEGNNPTRLGKVASEYVKKQHPQYESSSDSGGYGRSLGKGTTESGEDVAERLIRQGLGFPTSPEHEGAFREFLSSGRETEQNPELEEIMLKADEARQNPGNLFNRYQQISTGVNRRDSRGSRAFDRGTENLKASAYAFLQALNDVIGDDETSELRKRQALYYAQEAGFIRKDFESYKDVDSLSDAAGYAYELLMEEAPSLVLDAGLTITGAGAGAVIGRRAAITAMRKRLGDEAFEELATRHPQLMANAAADTAKAGAKRGAAAGFIGGIYPQEVAAVQQELTREGIEGEGATAFGMGAVSTAAQVLPEMALAGKLLKAADVDASDLGSIVGVGKEIAKNTGTIALAEGSAEAAATATYKSAVALHKDEYEIFSKKNIAEMEESFVAGATLGGVLGGTSTAGAAGYRKADEIYREKRQAAIDAEQLAREQEAQATVPAGNPNGSADIAPPEQPPAEKYEAAFEYGNNVDPAKDAPIVDENFNPKLDSQHEMKPFVPVGEAAPPAAPVAEQAQPVAEQAQPVAEAAAAPIVEENAAPEETVTEPKEITEHPAFQAVAAAIARTGKAGISPADLNPEEKQVLESFDAIVEDPLSPGELIVHPMLVNDVLTRSEIDIGSPKGLVYSGPAPTAAGARGGESLARGAQYGEGNPDPDGVYDRGTGRSVFIELADMAADENEMRKGSNGQTRATTKFKEMAETIDPLSDDFDTQLETLAKYVKTWGNNKGDDVNQKLDRARLREPDTTQTAPTLKESFLKLDQMHGTQMKGDALAKFQSAVKYIDQLATSLASTVEGFQKSKDFRSQMVDILDVVTNGGVELNAKQQSVVHAIAANSFVSTSRLWKSDTGTTNKVYAEADQKVVDAQVAPTVDKALEPPTFVSRKPDTENKGLLSKQYSQAKRALSKVSNALENLLNTPQGEGADLGAFSGKVRSLNQIAREITDWMRSVAPIIKTSKKRDKVLTNLGKEFADDVSNMPKLVEALEMRHFKDELDVQSALDPDSDGEGGIDPTLSVVGPSDKVTKGIADIGRKDADIEDLSKYPIDLAANEIEFLDRFVRASLGLTKGEVELMPLEFKVSHFSRHFVETTASEDLSVPARETKNERRVRIVSKLQTAVSIVGSFKKNLSDIIAQQMLPGFLKANPTKTEQDLEKDQNYINAVENMERKLFEATLTRLVGLDHPDYIEVYNIVSAREAIKKIRSEIQNLENIPADKETVSSDRNTSGKVVRDTYRQDEEGTAWGDSSVFVVENKRKGHVVGEPKKDPLDVVSEQLKQLDNERAPKKLGGRTSREMYDVSTTLISAINTTVRMFFDARFESRMHPEIRDAVRNGDYAALVDYAADNDLIPAMGNQLEQLINNTVEMAAANHTSQLTRYFVRKDKQKGAVGVVKLTMVDDEGNTTQVHFNLGKFIADHLERVSPNMENADHGARKGSDHNNDGVRDDSDPLAARAVFDRITHIKNAFDNLIADMADLDPRLFGFQITPESLNSILTNDNMVLLDDGPDTVTLKHLRDTLETRAVQARIADNYEATHDISETKQAKAAAAMQLEQGMIDLLNILAPERAPKDGTLLTRLAELLTRANGNRGSSAHISRAVANIPRQLGALSRLVYGDRNSHLDEVNNFDEDQNALLFTEPSLPESRMDALNKITFDARNSAHRSKTGVGRDELLTKYALDDKTGNDYTKTTEMVDIAYLAKVFDVIVANPEAFGISSIDGESLTDAYNRLVEARERLALSFKNRDYSSIADDKARSDDGNKPEIADSDALGRMDTQNWNEATRREKANQVRDFNDGDPELAGKITGNTPTEQFESGMAALRAMDPEKEPDPQRVWNHIRFSSPKLDEAVKKVNQNDAEATQVAHDDHIIPQVRGILGDSKAARLVSNALTRMANIVFGDPKFISNIEFSDSGDEGGSIETDGVKIYISLPFGTLKSLSAARMSRFIKVAAHEFGHAVATYNTLDGKDAADMLQHYQDDVPEPQRSEYSIDEYMADLVAMQILQEITVESIRAADDVTAARLAKNPGNTSALLSGEISRVVSSLVARISSLLRIAGEFGTRITKDGMFIRSPQLEFAEYLLKYSRIRKDKFDALTAQNRLYYTERGTTGVMAKAKAKAADLAKGGLNSAVVKLFKPVAMRLQKIDRQLARMFFNPPGAKQEHGMGLMDMAVSSRTQLVHNFNRLYSKVDDFRKDYNEFLKTGKSSVALNGVFRRAAEMYGKVNPDFKYTGVPLMINMDEITRRGAEFVQLLAHEKADALLKSFDRSGGDASMNTDIKPANPFGRQELIDELIRNRPEIREKLQSAGFFEPPTVAGLNKFFGGVAMRTEFERVFAGMNSVTPELGLSVRTPNQKLKDRLDAITDIDKRREAIAMIGSMLGFDGARVHPSWRATQDWTISVVSAMILPLSGFASLPDPMMPFIRTRSWVEATKGLFNVVKAYATDYKRTAELTRALSLATNTIHDTVWSNVVINRDGNTIPERISETLFKYNGLQFLTNLSRNVSAVLAIDMVRRHGSGTTPYSRQFLAEMGLTSDEAGRLIAYMDEHGTVPQYVPGNEMVNDLHDIAQRVVTTFTNSSLIHPNKAQLPAIANDPNFRVLTLLKPFMYGFHSTIYGGGLRSGRDAIGNPRTLGGYLLSSPAGVAPLMLAFGIMMPLAAAGLLAREHFRDFLFDSNRVGKLEAMDDMEYLSKIFSRAGGYGMAEYPMQIWEATQVDYRNPLVTALGPVASTLNTVGSDTYGAFVKGNRDSIRFGLFEVSVD